MDLQNVEQILEVMMATQAEKSDGGLGEAWESPPRSHTIWMAWPTNKRVTVLMMSMR